MDEKKRRHHYVYQRYLSAWTVNDQLWCRRKGKIFPSDTINVAQQRDFYRLRPVNQDEIALTLKLIAKNSPPLQQAILRHMSTYLEPLKWQKAVQSLKKVFTSEYGDNIPQEIDEQLQKLANTTDIAVNNTDEEYHSDIEGDSLKWLDALMAGDTSFYYNNREDIEHAEYLDDEAYHFLYFVSVQYFRTKAMRDRWVSNFRSMMGHPGWEQLGISVDNVDPENMAAHVFWVFQGLMAFNLRKRDVPLSLLLNETDLPFVTSDQPIINLKADYQKLDEMAEDLIFYYPISPHTAIILNDHMLPRKVRLAENQVEIYNRALIRASHESVFANRQDLLTHYQDVFPDTAPKQS